MVDDEKPPANGQTVDVAHATLRTTRVELPLQSILCAASKPTAHKDAKETLLVPRTSRDRFEANFDLSQNGLRQNGSKLLAKKKSDFEHPTKKKIMIDNEKMKEHARK